MTALRIFFSGLIETTQNAGRGREKKMKRAKKDEKLEESNLERSDGASLEDVESDNETKASNEEIIDDTYISPLIDDFEEEDDDLLEEEDFESDDSRKQEMMKEEDLENDSVTDDMTEDGFIPSPYTDPSYDISEEPLSETDHVTIEEDLVPSWFSIEIDWFDSVPDPRHQGQIFRVSFKNYEIEPMGIYIRSLVPEIGAPVKIDQIFFVPSRRQVIISFKLQFYSHKPEYLVLKGVLFNQYLKQPFKKKLDLIREQIEEKYYWAWSKHGWTFEDIITHIIERHAENAWRILFDVASVFLHKEGRVTWSEFIAIALKHEPIVGHKLQHTIVRMFKNMILGFRGAGKLLTLNNHIELDRFKQIVKKKIGIEPPTDEEIIKVIDFENLVFNTISLHRVEKVFSSEKLGPWHEYIQLAKLFRKYCVPFLQELKRNPEIDPRVVHTVNDYIHEARMTPYQDLERRLALFQKALKIARLKGTSFQIVYLIGSIAYARGLIIYSQKINLQLAQAYFQLARLAYHCLDLPPLYAWANSYYYESQATYFKIQRQYDRAVRALFRALGGFDLRKHSHLIRRLNLEFEAHRLAGVVASRQSDFITAERHFRKSSEILEELVEYIPHAVDAMRRRLDYVWERMKVQASEGS